MVDSCPHNFKVRAAAYIRFGVAFGILLGLCASATAAEKCTAEQKADADQQLWLNKRDAALAVDFHLPWGSPDSVGNKSARRLLAQRDYVIDYSDDLRVPIWTAHRLDTKGLDQAQRVDCFRQDPRVPSPIASLPSDYDEPIFDQGHLTPNGDMSRSLTSVLNSFVMTNMAPQHCFFNRGVWQILESLVRLWAKDKQTLYVTTGSVFDRNGDGRPDDDSDAVRMVSRNGKERVAVPSHFYKILIHQSEDGKVEALAVMLPNNDTNLDGEAALQYIQEHLVTVESIKAVTGLKFFPKAPSAPAVATTLWPITGSPSHSLASNCKPTH